MALGCDPAEEVRNELTPIDVAQLHGASAVVRWLLEQRVPVENSLQVGAHAVELELARDLLDRGASINAYAVTRALDNQDVEACNCYPVLCSRTTRSSGSGPASQQPTLTGQ